MISISVVIPAWNAGRFIGEAIDSVLSQSAAPDEIIVVDDGSTDHTSDCVGKFGTRVTLIAQPNAGVAAARNRGLAAAHGEAIALLDADDLMAPRRLEQQRAVLEHDPRCAVALGKQLTFRTEQERLALDSSTVDHSAVRPGYVPSAAMMRAGVFDLVGPFDAALRIGDFLDWITRAQSRGAPIQQMEQVVVYRRLHEASLSRSAGTQYANLVHRLRRTGKTK
ncbi:MAG: glycosyltransferase family A protein [Bradyrhizobium sp.]|nr:glycosyltransferase family A protein [Bradyrhizobium sp.]